MEQTQISKHPLNLQTKVEVLTIWILGLFRVLCLGLRVWESLYLQVSEKNSHTFYKSIYT
jgi:hypothetical protein